MHGALHRVLADASRLLNRLTGGKPGKTLCNRLAVTYGPDCVVCKLIGLALRQPFHCRDEMDAREVIDWLRRNP